MEHIDSYGPFAPDSENQTDPTVNPRYRGCREVFDSHLALEALRLARLIFAMNYQNHDICKFPL